jgi:hypothetical protein
MMSRSSGTEDVHRYLSWLVPEHGSLLGTIQNTTVSNDPLEAYSLERAVVLIPLGMTTWPVFTARITELTSGIKWLLTASSTSFPHVLNHTLGLLFQTSYSQSHISSFNHLPLSLELDYWSHRQLCLWGNLFTQYHTWW